MGVQLHDETSWLTLLGAVGVDQQHLSSYKRSMEAAGLDILPILMPPTWPGGEGNPCARRLFGSTQLAAEDPWVGIALTTPDRPDLQLLPPDGLEVLSEVIGRRITSDYAEQLACAYLDGVTKREALQVSPFAEGDSEVLSLVFEDFAASLILLPHVLTGVSEALDSPMLFVAIPTRATILFCAKPSTALKMAAIADGIQSAVPANLHLTSAIFLVKDGRIEGMGVAPEKGPLRLVRL